MKNSIHPSILSGAAIAALIAASISLVSCEDDGANATASNDSYPLTTCVVSGEPLGSMGDPIVINYEGTTVKFCCGGCEDDFRAEPAKFLAMISAAAEVNTAN